MDTEVICGVRVNTLAPPTGITAFLSGAAGREPLLRGEVSAVGGELYVCRDDLQVVRRVLEALDSMGRLDGDG